MQSFLRKVVTQHHRHRHHHHHLHQNLSSYSSSHRTIFHTHTAFSSLPKPLSQQQQQQLLLGHRIPTTTTTFFFPTQHYSHSLSQIRGFLSNPRIASKWRNSLARLSSTSRIRSLLLDFRPKLPTAHFHRNSFGFNQSSDLYRGWRSWIRRLTPNEVVLGLIMANVAVFLLWRIADEKFMINNFTVSLNNFKSGRLHTLITSAFSHIDTGHIISNMIGLYFFGMNIGRNFGPEFLLKLYLAGAVGGSIFYLVHQAYKAQTSKGWRFMSPSRELALGASGAVNAIMLLDIFLFPKATLYFDFIIPVPAILLGIFLIGKDMLRIIEGDSQISGAAHLGGAAVAAIAWARVRKGRF